ncbi:hypothetical protein [Paracoccus sp. TOH]|uniref:hypothetical protein n=1 Tax=Paracoccus sp. TOH TaxID=1263728 RepID=UPI0025B019D7|nr:hypothetical protein [Paracoccus sp. TOH]WJS84153.1 hypothetical protein NBE95_10330 [Paracoccus sp. TOH]
MNPKSLFLGLALAALASPVAAESYLGRCKMGECLHYDQSDRRVEAQGSSRVPGDLVRVTLRQAVSDRPDTPKKHLQFDAPSEVRFFCSTARPAFGLQGGGYQGLNLGQIFGANELVANMYLRACHPGVDPGRNIEATLQGFGYRPTPDGTFASFEALIR